MYKNEARLIEPRTDFSKDVAPYTFDAPSRYLLTWSRLFQCVISQAGTYLFTDKFHTQQPGIFKAEGGINLPGVGEVTLYSQVIAWDGYSDYGHSEFQRRNRLTRLQALIAGVVVAWNPEDPIETMLVAAAVNIGCDRDALDQAIRHMHVGPFAGNPLGDFFGWNTFGPAPEETAYRTWCDEQKFAEKHLAKMEIVDGREKT